MSRDDFRNGIEDAISVLRATIPKTLTQTQSGEIQINKETVRLGGIIRNPETYNLLRAIAALEKVKRDMDRPNSLKLIYE